MAQTTPSEVTGANSAAPVAVLVVDGNEDHQILSIAALTRKGWIVRTAGTRKQGLQLALEYHFDAIAIGSKLRDGNGIELLRALGGRLPGTPIIFVVPLGGEEAALKRWSPEPNRTSSRRRGTTSCSRPSSRSTWWRRGIGSASSRRSRPRPRRSPRG